ncbi:MAG TPA: hypothetical protein VGL99_27980 [Chloroflexota bacterium]
MLIGLSLVVALATDNPLVVLLRGSVSRCVFALLCFGSLAVARSLMFYVARQFTSGWDRVSQRDACGSPLAWGCWLLAEAAGRALAALLLPISIFLAMWPVVANVGTFAMIYWSTTYSRSRGSPD